MPTDNSAELLIRIGADASAAETNIESFRAQFAGLAATANGIAASFAVATRALTPIDAGLGVVDVAAQHLASTFNLSTTAINNVLAHNQRAAQAWKLQLVANFLDVLDAQQALESTLGRSFMQFDDALGSNIANAVVWQKSIGEAFRKAAEQAVDSIAQEAAVRAIYSTALGFYLLATMDFSGAAQAFKSAATFALVGGAASLAGRALANADAGAASANASSAQSGSASAKASVSAATSGASAQNAQPLQVIFQGPVYGGQAGIDQLVRQISQAVTQRDVNLVAYTVVRQPAPRA
jgi:hypothetical protein